MTLSKQIKLSDWFSVLPLLHMRSWSIDGLSVSSDIAKTAKIELVTNKPELVTKWLESVTKELQSVTKGREMVTAW